MDCVCVGVWVCVGGWLGGWVWEGGKREYFDRGRGSLATKARFASGKLPESFREASGKHWKDVQYSGETCFIMWEAFTPFRCIFQYVSMKSMILFRFIFRKASGIFRFYEKTSKTNKRASGYSSGKLPGSSGFRRNNSK